MLTKFQSRVLEEVKKIPKGKVMTYKQIAEKIGSSPRAVGQVLKRNPYPIEIPCHRVIKSDGSLGGYKGKISSKVKKKLLRREGCVVV